MARFKEPTLTQEREWKKWVASRPVGVRAVASRFEPWSLYRLKSTGHRVTVQSFGETEDGTVTLTVAVTGEFNKVLHERAVFGIDPNDLEPCNLPLPGEPLGADLSQTEVEENLDALRVMIRPDLWMFDDAGNAQRKQ